MNRIGVPTMRLRMTLIMACCVLWASDAHAQTAGMVSFQGLIRSTATGNPPITTPVSLEFRIFNADTGGTQVDMDGDGTLENTPAAPGAGTDAILVGPLTPNGGIVSTKFGPVSPKAFTGCTPGVAGCCWLEVTVVGSATPLSRLEMVTPPGAAEQVNKPAGSPLIVQDINGNVGIGITTPRKQLSIGTNLDLYSDPPSTHIRPSVRGSINNNLVLCASGAGAVFLNFDGGTGGVRIHNGTSPGELMRIDGDGKVGIGTTTPFSKLSYGGAGTVNSATKRFGVHEAANGSFFTGIAFAGPTGAEGLGLWGGTDSLLPFDGVTGVQSHLFVQRTSGNVGIGTTTPATKLHVVGNIVATGTCNCSSDSRLKTNIANVASALDKLLSLRGVWFQWKSPKEHGDEARRQMGMIAQEVERVLPEWVIKDKDGYRYLNTTGFPALAVEAIREMKDENDALKSKVSALEVRLARLERAIGDKSERSAHPERQE